MIELDYAILHFFNRDLANPVFDFFFPMWTDIQKNPIFLAVIIPAMLVFIIRHKNWTLLKIILLALLTTWIANNLNDIVFKAYFARPRPSGIILRVSPLGSYSFPSGHAVIAFFFATIMSLFYPSKKFIFYTLAFLTAFSRVYCGVHFPADITVGAIVGASLAYLTYKLVMMTKYKTHFTVGLLSLFFVLPAQAYALKDPTKGKPTFKWMWEDQFKPTLKKSVDKGSLIILGSGIAASVGTHEFDKKIYNYNKDHRFLFDEKGAEQFAKLGNGLAGVGIAVTQYFFDQENGLRHMRALILTTTSHMGIAALVRRNRPENNSDFLGYPSSFPSGHASSAFATAGSLAYSYGWVAGVPAYAVASAISLSRIRADRHWASDIVAGAFLGTFWARASAKADEDKDPEAVMYVPSPVYDGMMISAIKAF